MNIEISNFWISSRCTQLVELRAQNLLEAEALKNEQPIYQKLTATVAQW